VIREIILFSSPYFNHTQQHVNSVNFSPSQTHQLYPLTLTFTQRCQSIYTHASLQTLLEPCQSKHSGCSCIKFFHLTSWLCFSFKSSFNTVFSSSHFLPDPFFFFFCLKMSVLQLFYNRTIVL
jgi:hypothetical protein